MFALVKHLKKKESPSKRCVHQTGITTVPESSVKPSFLVGTEDAIGVANDIGESSPEQLAIEPHKGQQTQSLPTTHDIPAGNTPCSICREEKRSARRYRWLLIGGLFLPFTVQALDATIIAGALPFIASDFQELAQLNWIVSAFNLTSATFIPAWGQFADIFGRHVALQAALVLMLIGSTLCAAAPTNAFPMLLVGRALQGISCSGCQIVTRVILADKVSLQEYAKNNTIFALIGGIGYGLGPVIGGYLTQVSWRWCFIINLPVASLGIIFALFVLRPHLLGPQNTITVDDTGRSNGMMTFKARLLTIDYGGQFLFLFGMGLLVLALTWGGSYYPWSDVKVLAPLIIGFVTFCAFLVWEFFMMPGRRLAKAFPEHVAMLPFKLIGARNFGLLLYINFITGMALFAVFYFVDIYFTLVLDYPPGKAGIQLLYYTPGLGAGVYLAIFACNVYPRQTWFPLAFGTIIEPLGITLLAVAINMNNVSFVLGMLGLTGVGTGIRFMPGQLHGVGYFPNQVASIVSLVNLAIALGGTFAMTLMFTVFNNSLSNAGIVFKGGSSDSFSQISALPTDSQNYLRDHARSAIALSFYALSSFLWLGVIAVAFLGNVKITRDGKESAGTVLDSRISTEAGVRDFSQNVVDGGYLESLFRRRNALATPGNVSSSAQQPDAEKNLSSRDV